MNSKHKQIRRKPRVVNYMTNLFDGVLIPPNSYIKNAQIYNGLQALQWEMDLLIVPFHHIREIQIMPMTLLNWMVWFYFPSYFEWTNSSLCNVVW
jgi:uncharacterized membrane protein